jgi:hypothetical protein
MLAGSAMMVWTWQTWADVTIDFGRELYVPWQMTEGKVLYRDIAYFNGPFSPCVNYVLRRLALSNLVRPMPAVMLALGAACFAALLKPGLSPEARQRMVMRMMLATFALVLLAKILFKVQVAHYGFALAMPAALLSTVAVLDWIPAMIARIGGSGAVFRAGSLALLLLAGTDLLRGFERVLNHKTYAVGSGSDLIRTDGRAHFINPLLEEIQRRLSPKDTLLVLPEGVMLNYLSRRVNPTALH